MSVDAARPGRRATISDYIAIMRLDREVQKRRHDAQLLKDLEADATDKTGSAAMIESMRDRYRSRP